MKRRRVEWRISAILAISLPLTLSATACSSSNNSFNNNSLYLHYISSLESEKSGIVLEAMQSLFESGKTTIPFLVDVLNSKKSFWGFCGTSSVQIQLEEVDFDSGYIVGHPDSVGEAALYLIEAILRSDFYFARTCSLVVAGNTAPDSQEVYKRVAQVSSTLADLSLMELESLSVQGFEEIMRSSGIAFPQRE